MSKTILFCLFIFLSHSVFSHGDLDERIVQLTLEIKKFPTRIDLLFQRAELYFKHEEYEKAQVDLDNYKSASTVLQKAYLLQAKIFYQLDKYDKAEININQFLNQDTNNVRALRLKGQILFANKSYCEAAEIFENLVSLAHQSYTNNYLKIAESYSKCKKKDAFFKTLEVIHKGIAHLGPIYNLLQFKKEFLVSNYRLNQALETQTAIIDILKRKEFALFERGQLFELLGDNEKAHLDYKKSLNHLLNLSYRQLKSASVQKLNQSLIQKLNR